MFDWLCFFFSSRRRHTRLQGDWSSDVCSSDVVRDAVREDVADRDLERDREDVEAREHVFRGRTARTRDSAEIARGQVDEVEDPLLIELIGIVELAGDDPAAVRQIVDEGVDEPLIVETHFTAGGIPGVVTLELAETVNKPIGLRAVVVRQDRETIAEDPVVVLVIIIILAAGYARDLHGLGPAGELPQQLVAAAQRIRRTRSRCALELVRELDAVHDLVLEARALSNVELVAVAVARAKALVALTWLVERIEVHDQIELVVRAVRHPSVGVGVVGAGLVEDGQRLSMAGRLEQGGRDTRKGEPERRGAEDSARKGFETRLCRLHGYLPGRKVREHCNFIRCPGSSTTGHGHWMSGHEIADQNHWAGGGTGRRSARRLDRNGELAPGAQPLSMARRKLEAGIEGAKHGEGNRCAAFRRQQP